jgi:hypothetical protein
VREGDRSFDASPLPGLTVESEPRRLAPVADSSRRWLHLGRPGRVAGVRALVVLGTLLLLVSVLAIWVNRLALETDTWTDTSEELLEDDEVRAVLAASLTDRLYSSVDVAARLQEILPPAADPLAGPAAAGLREFTERRANIFLQRPRVVAAWREVNRTAHAQFVRIVNDEAAAIETQGGDVVLLLRPLLADLATQVGLGEEVVTRLPEDAGSIVVMEADQLEALQTIMRILDIVATWLWAIALLCWALAVYLSPDRRLKTLRGISFGLLFVGLGVLAILRIAGNFIVNSLVQVDANRPAVDNVLDIVTAALRTSALALAAIGLLLLIGVWLSGPGRRATAFRRWSAPGLRDHPELVWGAFAFLVLLVLIWGPIRATRNLVGIVVLVGLAALGLWAFRRVTLTEFPEATWTGWRLRRPGGDDRVAQLERLAALHEQGALSEKEFEAEKAALLRPGA